MPGIFWRIIIAVLGVVFAILIIPPFCRVLGFTMNGDVWLIVRLCIAGIALFYVLLGRKPAPPS